MPQVELVHVEVLVAVLWIFMHGYVADDVSCLKKFKESVKDPTGHLISWNFESISRGSICSFNGVQCWNDQENRVLTLKLSGAGLSGPFPSGLSACTSMTGLDLSNNDLLGNIPSNICQQLPYLTSLDLSQNKFMGMIPGGLADCKYLHELHIQDNRLTGSIPWGIGVLPRLNDLDLSSNYLSGQIPSSFTNRSDIGQAGFSVTVFGNNPGLCGPPLQSSCSSKTSSKLKVPMIVAGAIAVSLILALITGAVMWWVLLQPKKKPSTYILDKSKWARRIRAPNSVMVSMFEKPLVRLRLSDLMAATNDFGQDNIVASGRTGTLYKACLSDGSILAIKRLQISSHMEKQFRSEMSILGQLRHRNLVPLLGYCVAGGEKLLVYKHMAHGSLRSLLHEASEEKKLDWITRLKVAIGSARGFTWLHHNCNPRVIHRNISASCILLDKEDEPRITDFGLARLMNPVDTHISTFVNGDFGDAGYVAPEYIRTLVATIKGDVYSFGVVLLELVTGQKAMEVVGESDFKGNLAEWISYLSTNERLQDAIDQSLKGKEEFIDDELLQFLRVACRCVLSAPKERPTMFEVYQLLSAIGEKYNLTDVNDGGVAISMDINDGGGLAISLEAIEEDGENTIEVIVGSEK